MKVEAQIRQLEETLSRRIAKLEEQVSEMSQRLNSGTAPPEPWWEKIFGSFADSEEYEQAMRLGREYRESLRPKDNEG